MNKSKKVKFILCGVLITSCAIMPITLYSCEKKQKEIINPPKIDTKTEKQNLLNEYLKNINPSLKYTKLDNIFASSIIYKDIELEKTLPENIVFQIQSMVSDDNTGNLKLSYYLRIKDNSNAWIVSKTVNKEITGFKTIQQDIDANIKNNLKVTTKENLDNLLPSQVLINNENFIFSDFNNLKYKVEILQKEADDKLGNIELEVKLKTLNNEVSSVTRKYILKGYLTLEQKNINEINSFLKLQLTNTNTIALNPSINKENTQASEIHIESSFSELIKDEYKIVINKIKADNETGTLKLTFLLESTKNPNIKSDSKEIIINGFLTNAKLLENEKQAKKIYLENKLNNISLSLIDKDKKEYLASTITKDDLKVLNLEDKESVNTIEINSADDANGLLNVNISLQYEDEKLGNITTQTKIISIDGFKNTNEVIDELKVQLAKINTIDLDSQINKQETKASAITKENFINLKTTNYEIFIKSLNADDNNGTLQVTINVKSLRNETLVSEDKQITLTDFLTNEAELQAKKAQKLSKLEQKFNSSIINVKVSKETTLPSEVTLDNLSSKDLNENETLEITEISNSDDENGSLTISAILKYEDNELGQIQTQTKQITLNDFQTIENRNKAIEKARLEKISQDVNYYILKENSQRLITTKINDLTFDKIQLEYPAFNFKLDNVTYDEATWKDLEKGTITFSADVISLDSKFKDVQIHKTITFTNLVTETSLTKIKEQLNNEFSPRVDEVFNANKTKYLDSFNTTNNDNQKQQNLQKAKDKIIEKKLLEEIYKGLKKEIVNVSDLMLEAYSSTYGNTEEIINIQREILKSLEISLESFLSIFLVATQKQIVNPEISGSSWEKTKFFQIGKAVMSHENLKNFGILTTTYFEHIKTINNKLKPLNRSLLQTRLKINPEFSNMTNLDEIIEEILSAIDKENNTMSNNLQYNANDWKYIFFGGQMEGYSETHIAQTGFTPSNPNLGRKWLALGGWNQLFSTKRYSEHLQNKVKEIIKKHNLNENQQTEILNIVNEIFAVYAKLVDLSQNKIYQFSQYSLLGKITDITP